MDSPTDQLSPKNLRAKNLRAPKSLLRAQSPLSLGNKETQNSFPVWNIDDKQTRTHTVNKKSYKFLLVDKYQESIGYEN